MAALTDMLKEMLENKLHALDIGARDLLCEWARLRQVGDVAAIERLEPIMMTQARIIEDTIAEFRSVRNAPEAPKKDRFPTPSRIRRTPRPT